MSNMRFSTTEFRGRSRKKTGAMLRPCSTLTSRLQGTLSSLSDGTPGRQAIATVVLTSENFCDCKLSNMSMFKTRNVVPLLVVSSKDFP